MFTHAVLLKDNKTATIDWIKEQISPLNGGRTSRGAFENCVLLAEKCVKVLLKQESPALVPARRITPKIAFKKKSGKIVYHAFERRKEQDKLFRPNRKIEAVNLADNKVIRKFRANPEVNYHSSTLADIANDIKAMPGSAESQGKDKTLAGMIYYYYEGVDQEGLVAGHLANFYRDSEGNVYFVDAQSVTISDKPLETVLSYKIRKEEIYYRAVPPQSGFYVKKEKIEQQPEEVSSTHKRNLDVKNNEKTNKKFKIDKNVDENGFSSFFFSNSLMRVNQSIKSDENNSSKCVEKPYCNIS